MVIANGRLAVGDVPGLKSVPMATGMPRSMNVRAGAPWSFMRNQVVTGRTVATTGAAVRRCLGEGGDPGLGRRRQVVGGERADLGGQLGAAGRRELVGVQPGRHAQARRRLEDPARLIGVEDAGLAEHVAEERPPVGGDARAAGPR